MSSTTSATDAFGAALACGASWTESTSCPARYAACRPLWHRSSQFFQPSLRVFVRGAASERLGAGDLVAALRARNHPGQARRAIAAGRAASSSGAHGTHDRAAPDERGEECAREEGRVEREAAERLEGNDVICDCEPPDARAAQPGWDGQAV